MKIERFALGSLGTNCYLIVNEENQELVIVDPAVRSDYLMSHVKMKGYTPKAILLTHAHFDHVMGIDGWQEEYDLPVYLHEEEKEILIKPSLNLSQMFGTEYSYDKVHCLKDGDEITLAGIAIKAIRTPGHTKGSCCYYIEDEEVLISGDTLFCQSVGRSDFPTGDAGMLINSIREKLFCLPDDTLVYPGHDRQTCIADEKRLNPFV